MKRIKICCQMMKDYIENYRVGVNCEGNARIDTAIYEDSPLEIDYCPWCGKVIEYKYTYIKAARKPGKNELVPEIWANRILKELERAEGYSILFNKAGVK